MSNNILKISYESGEVGSSPELINNKVTLVIIYPLLELMFYLLERNF
jgi:hypothetical protein